MGVNESLNAEMTHTKDNCTADNLFLSTAYGLRCGNCGAHDESSTVPTQFDTLEADYLSQVEPVNEEDISREVS